MSIIISILRRTEVIRAALAFVVAIIMAGIQDRYLG
jgi:hypothetical protein